MQCTLTWIPLDTNHKNGTATLGVQQTYPLFNDLQWEALAVDQAA